MNLFLGHLEARNERPTAREPLSLPLGDSATSVSAVSSLEVSFLNVPHRVLSFHGNPVDTV